MNPTYLHTARLLTQVAPSVFADGIFALKGGTAINLFLRDMPRLSVDLDVVFPDHRVPRNVALAQIQQAMGQAAERLRARGFQTHSVPTKLRHLQILRHANPRKFVEQAKLLADRLGVVL